MQGQKAEDTEAECVRLREILVGKYFFDVQHRRYRFVVAVRSDDHTLSDKESGKFENNYIGPVVYVAPREMSLPVDVDWLKLVSADHVFLADECLQYSPEDFNVYLMTIPHKGVQDHEFRGPPPPQPDENPPNIKRRRYISVLESDSNEELVFATGLLKFFQEHEGKVMSREANFVFGELVRNYRSGYRSSEYFKCLLCESLYTYSTSKITNFFEIDFGIIPTFSSASMGNKTLEIQCIAESFIDKMSFNV